MARTSLNKRKRRQTITYWAQQLSSGVPKRDKYGKYLYESPVELSARWEEKTMPVVNDEGEDVTIGTVVYVDRAMVKGDILWLGTSAAATPQDNRGYGEIERVEVSPHTGGLRGAVPEQDYTVYL